MYCKVHRPVNTPGVCDNKGSCKLLIDYLSKEGSEDRAYVDSFFSSDSNFITADEAQNTIDHNKKNVGKKQDKFYMLTVNPSKDELRCLIERTTGKRVDSFTSLSPDEQKDVIRELKNYARKCMDEYAQNFYREKIKSNKDLVWFGRVETERHYKNMDNEVQNGMAKDGDLKPGLQLHIHIVVSRMDKTQTVSLSPLSRSRGNRQVLKDKGEVVVGFDRNEWSNRCATRFTYDYNYFPYYVKNYKEYKEWRQQEQMKNMAVRKLKSELLQGQLKYERKLLYVSVRAFRFVINPKTSFLNEVKNISTDLLSGKIL